LMTILCDRYLSCKSLLLERDLHRTRRFPLLDRSCGRRLPGEATPICVQLFHGIPSSIQVFATPNRVPALLLSPHGAPPELTPSPASTARWAVPPTARTRGSAASTLQLPSEQSENIAHRSSRASANGYGRSSKTILASTHSYTCVTIFESGSVNCWKLQ
jgi:hypothetical protein